MSRAFFPLTKQFTFSSALLASALLSQAAFAVLPAVEIDKVATAPAPTSASATPVMPSSAPSTAAPSAMPASTNSADQIQTRLTAAIVSVDATGKETLAPLTSQTQLAPGNVVEYHGYLINNSPDRLRKMKVTFGIPNNMELVGTVTPDLAYGSNDGQNFMYMPIKANINGVVQNVPMSYYKALQWDVTGLGLNEVAEVKYRAKVK